MREALNNPAFTGRGDNKVLNIIAGGKYGKLTRLINTNMTQFPFKVYLKCIIKYFSGITSNEGPEWLGKCFSVSIFP